MKNLFASILVAAFCGHRFCADATRTGRQTGGEARSQGKPKLPK